MAEHEKPERFLSEEEILDNLVERELTPEEAARQKELFERWEDKGLLRNAPEGSVQLVGKISRADVAEAKHEMWDDVAEEPLISGQRQDPANYQPPSPESLEG